MKATCEMKKYMRFAQEEKHEIIRMVTRSDLSVNRTLKELGLHKRTFYNWYARYLKDGYDGLAYRARDRRQTWNRIPQHERNKVVEEALEHPELSSRELAIHIVDKHKWFISESSVYRILKERGLITAPSHIKRILPTSKSSDGAGIICLPFWMITAGILSHGSCVLI